MTTFDLADLASADLQQLSQLIKNSSADQISTALQGDNRTTIFNEIFTRMPGLLRADRAADINTVIHWIITDRPEGGGDTYELVIADGVCTLSETPGQEPKLALILGPVDFVKVVSGNANPVMLFMTGKLKAKGDLGLAANIVNLFDIPKA